MGAYGDTNTNRGYDAYGYDRGAFAGFAKPQPAPKPTGPCASDLQSYHSDTYRSNPVRQTLHAPDLDTALTIVAAFGGRTDMPIASDLAERTPDAGGLGVAIIALGEIAAQGAGEKKLDRVLGDIRNAFSTEPEFFRDGVIPAEGGGARYVRYWDYDTGPFSKCSIRVTRKADGFDVHLTVVGGNPEPRLAKELGVALGFSHSLHTLTFASQGNRYQIPLNHIARIARLCGADRIDPQALFAQIKQPIMSSDGSYRSEEHSPATLFEDEQILATVELTAWRIPSSHDLARLAEAEGVKFDLISLEPNDYASRLDIGGEDGDMITGRAKMCPQWNLPWAAGIELKISPKTAYRYDRQVEERILAIAKSIDSLYFHLKPAF